MTADAAARPRAEPPPTPPSSVSLRVLQAGGPVAARPAEGEDGFAAGRLVRELLREQHALTAVERFAHQHDAGALPSEPLYRDLLPLERPNPGEQYAFEVDLDACTGCKACVAACHTLNGLDAGETWRSVGLLQGGTSAAPAIATVTTSCHHCVEPACLHGCPVQAYEKDSVTGIVRHLDDQCFGCGYCTLMCPYDAPKLNAERGIVRKCDMCSDRLAHGEAPACVAACPNGAIAIRVVDQRTAIESSDALQFLPGSPAPDHTIPTTVYKTHKALPANMLPADFYATRPEHAHPPLVALLTLTQLAAGAFGLRVLLERLLGAAPAAPLAGALFAATAALLALGASVLHLGRPHLFWRGFLGWRTSWLSREAIAFGAFAQLALLAAAFAALPMLPAIAVRPRLAEQLAAWHQLAEVGGALAGALGVYFSVMVYVATRREQWSASSTGVRFFGSTLVLGAAALLVLSALGWAPPDPSAPNATSWRPSAPVGATLLWLVLASSALKLAFEGSQLRSAGARRHTATKRMAVLLLGQLRRTTTLRFALGALGGLVLPALLLQSAPASPFAPALTVLLFANVLAAETCERYLFFRAAPPSRMPGAIR